MFAKKIYVDTAIDNLNSNIANTATNLQTNQNFLQNQISDIAPVINNIKKKELVPIGGKLIIRPNDDDYNEFGGKAQITKNGKNIISIETGLNKSNFFVYTWNETNLTWEQTYTFVHPTSSSSMDYSISEDLSTVAIGDSYAVNNDGIGSGVVWVYNLVNGEYKVQDSFEGPNEDTRLGFRARLDASGKKLAICELKKFDPELFISEFFGKVTIYHHDGSKWVQLGQPIEAEKVNDYLGGGDVVWDKEGKRILISSDGTDIENKDNVGSANYFEYSETEDKWVKVADTIYGLIEGEMMGYRSADLSEDGNILSIGSIAFDGAYTYSDLVRVWKLEDGKWTQLGQTIRGIDGTDFGITTGISGDGTKLIIGDWYGKAYYYEYHNDKWVKAAFDLSTDGQAGHQVTMSYDGKICCPDPLADQSNGVVGVYEVQKINYGELYIDVGNVLKIKL